MLILLGSLNGKAAMPHRSAGRTRPGRLVYLSWALQSWPAPSQSCGGGWRRVTRGWEGTAEVLKNTGSMLSMVSMEPAFKAFISTGSCVVASSSVAGCLYDCSPSHNRGGNNGNIHCRFG